MQEPHQEAQVAQAASMRTQLLPYQEEAVKWCMKNESECCILAYDMGLGKTVITCAVLSQKPMKTMILLPCSLIHQWHSELNKFTQGLKIFVYHGTHRRKMHKEFAEADIILTTPAVVANDIRDGIHMLRSVQRWVIDEAHKLRNAKGKIYMKLHNFAPFIRNKIFLTGTPICNKPDDLISILCLSNIDHYNDVAIWKHTSVKTKIEMLDSIMPSILSRKTKEGAITLPKLHIHDCVLNIDSEEQKNTYNTFVSDDELLRRILRMRQSLNNHRGLLEGEQTNDISSKIKTVEEIIAKIPKSEKIIIFSNFTGLLKHMFDTLSINANMCLYHGALDIQTKSDVLNVFKNDPETQVLLINLKSGSCGLNLTEANHVIIMEPYWNDSEYQQAINRAYRIGQTKEVHVYNISIKNSIELWLRNMQELKNKISKMLVDSDHSITINDIECDTYQLRRLFRCIGNVPLIERDEDLHTLLEQDV
jgi:SNF2 family DNA or RNA helicase